MTSFRDPESIKGTGSLRQTIPLESHRRSTSTYTPVTHIFLLLSVNVIRRFMCKTPSETRGAMAWALGVTQSGQSKPKSHSAQGSDDPVRAERRRI